MAALNVTIIPNGFGRGVAVQGELDGLTAPVLIGAVTALQPAGTKKERYASGDLFQLDLSAVTFLDSGGLDALACINNHLTSHEDQPAVTAPAARTPRWLLELAITNRWLPATLTPTDTHAGETS